ncbi:MAG: hypothetical protein JJE34_00500 [Alphaproteobacteria bacterium]|nr:hypothetical protein [Alphaproteobacteria bacterium]
MRCKPDMPLRRKYLLLAAVLYLAIAVLAFAVLAIGKGDARAAYDRGVTALGKGDVRTARIELLNAVKADPQWPQARLMQARALLALGDGLGAEADISRARDLGAVLPQTRHLMARALTVKDSDEIMLITVGGQMVRTPVKQIREAGRNTMGVKLVNLDPGDKLQAIAPVIAEPDEVGDTSGSPV